MTREDSARHSLAGGAKVWSVTELSREVERRLKGLGRITVEGEITQLKRAGSGHTYFGLKDLDALLSCAIWKSRLATAVRFDLQDGQRVLCHGELDVYKPRGSYSFIVDRVEQRGIGDLLVRFEALKKELALRGWFDRKRALPAYPRCIGIVTSRDGAALQDFLRTRSLRWPLYPLRLAHSSVQGATAAGEIAQAIRRLDQSGVDVIVLTRGGGSLEDLWCFNELVVAEAIHATSVPLVSAVGHETDVTLADFVADARAHTPTDAAQRVIPDRTQLQANIERWLGYLSEAMERVLEQREQRLLRLALSRELKSPEWIFGERRRSLQEYDRRLRHLTQGALAVRGLALERAATRLAQASPGAAQEARAQRTLLLGLRLRQALGRALDASQTGLDLAAARLAAISPLAVLGRGYSLTLRRSDGSVVRSSASLRVGDELESLLHAGRVFSRVEQISPESQAGGGA